MMKDVINSTVIWKFPLFPDMDREIEMPKGAKVLAVQCQHNAPQIWALVDPLAPMEIRRFKTMGTGDVIENDPGNYIGTFQLSGGCLVFHVFEQ